MLQALAHGQPFAGVPVQHHLDEVAGLVASMRDDGLDRDRRLLWPLEAQIAREFEALGPVRLSRGAENLTQLLQLVILASPWEQRT